jgi:Ca-activated chloride channel family protein
MKYLSIALLFLLVSCSSSKRASYYSTQKSIEDGNFSFAETLRVDEYLNAFEQPQMASPANKDVNLDVKYFYSNQPKGQKTTLTQIAVKTRKPTKAEEAKTIALSIVLDISGSMGDGKLEDAKKALIESIRELRSGTILSIVLFDDEAEVLIPPTSIGLESKAGIIQKVQKVQTDGGTNIEAGLILGYKQMASFSKAAVARLILITDGQSNVGVTDPKKIAEHAKVKYLEGARISTVGIGGGVDEKVLRKIAEKGQGHYYYADKATTLAMFLREDLKSIMIPVLKASTITIQAQQGFKIKTIYGFEDKVKEGREVVIQLPELNVDDWRILMTEVEGPESARTDAIPLKVALNYSTSNENKTITASPKIAWQTKDKASINPDVARNSVLLSNAMALKKIAKLQTEGKTSEALDLTNLQLTNIRLAKDYDESVMYANEETTFIKVKKSLEKAQNIETTQQEPESRKNILIRNGLELVKRVVPGPWSLIISLFELAL